jgi:hypothetical protein
MEYFKITIEEKIEKIKTLIPSYEQQIASQPKYGPGNLQTLKSRIEELEKWNSNRNENQSDYDNQMFILLNEYYRNALRHEKFDEQIISDKAFCKLLKF